MNVEFDDPTKKIPVAFNSDSKKFDVSLKVGGGGGGGGGGGENGATFTPAVSEDGVISWTNDKGLPNPDPVNIKGKDGVDGKDGTNGKDGYTPVKGVDYFDGVNGKDGKDGTNGYTPVRGIDYYTEADKTEMVSAVIAALPVYGGEVESV